MPRGEPLIRQWNLLKALQVHRFGIGLDELAERLECNKRTVQRDLNVLQQAGFPVGFEQRDFGKKFWRLGGQFVEREELMLSITEMLSLFLGRQVLAPLAGTQFGDGLASAVDKIKALLPASALGFFDDLDDNLLVKPVASQDYSAHDKEIRIINQAMTEGRSLKIRYHSASQDRTIETGFDPYGLVFFGVSLYCIGYLDEYDEVRTLKVTRFEGVELTADEFERPANFSLQAYTRGSFGVFSPGKFGVVRVRFTGWAMTNVREHKWHASQTIVKESADWVTAEFELSSTVEFKRWILGFGPCAVVLKPKALAREIADELAEARAAYS